MADNFKTTVEAEIKTPGADIAKSNLQEITKAINTIKAAAAGATNNLTGLLNQGKPAGDLRRELRELQTQLRTLSALTAGTKFLPPSWDSDVRKGQKDISDLAKAFKQFQTATNVKNGILPTDTQGVKDQIKYLTDLGNARRAVIEGLKQQRAAGVLLDEADKRMIRSAGGVQTAINGEIAKLRELEAALKRAANPPDPRKIQEQLGADTIAIQKRTDAANRATRLAEENAAREIIAIQKRKDAEDRATPQAKRNVRLENARTATADMSDPEFIQQRQRQQALSMVSRINNPEGNAALMGIQATLIANYSVINGALSAIKSSISFSVELEAAFKNLQAVAGITRTEMVGLQKVIVDVAGSTKFSATEVADAALILGQAGLSAAQIAQSIKPIVLLATAAGTSLQQSVELVTSIVGVFNVSTSETADIANKVTQAVNASKLSVDKLSLGLQYAGNTASQLGISFEEVTAAMAAMSNAGIKSGSTMGTGLRQFLVEVQKPSEEFLATLNRLGLSIQDVDFKANGLTGVAKKLRDAGFVASDAIKSFDVRGAAAFNALIANPEDMQRQLEGLYNTQAAVKANETQMEALKNQAARLTSAFQNLVYTGFGPVGDSLKVIISGMADLLNAANDNTFAVQALGVAMAGFAAATIAKYIGGLVTGFLSLRAAIVGATVAQSGLNVAMSANVVGVAVAALIAAFAIYKANIKSAADEMDALKAKTSDAQAAFNAKGEAIKALNAKIDELKARESLLKSDTAALRVEILEVNNKFAEWGVGLSLTNTKLETLVAKLKSVRGQVQQLALENLKELTNTSAASFAKAGEAQMEASREFLNKRQRANGSVGEAYTGREQLNKLTTGSTGAELLKALGGDTSIFNDLKAVVQEINKGRNTANIVGFSTVPSILNRAASSPNLSPELKDLLTVAIESTTALKDANTAYFNERGAFNSNKDTLDRENRFSDFNKNIGINDFLSSIPSVGASATASLKAKGGDTSDPIALAKEGAIVLENLKEQIKFFEENMVGTKTDQETLKRAKTMLVQARSELDSGYLALKNAADPQFEAKAKIDDYQNQLSMKGINNRIKRGIFSQADINNGQDLIRQKENNNFQEAVRKGNLLPNTREYQAAVMARDAAAQTAIETFMETVAAAQAEAAAKLARLDEASFRAKIDAKVRQANKLKRDINKFSDYDQIERNADAGLKLLEEAHMADAIRLDSEQKRNKTVGTAVGLSEFDSLNDKWTAIKETYVNDFTSLIEATSNRIYDFTAKFKEIRERVENAALLAKETIERAAAPLRETQINVARAKGPVSGRGYSVPQVYTLERQEERDRLPDVRGRIAANRTNQEAQYGNYNELSEIEAELRLKKIIADSKIKGKNPDTLSGNDQLKYNEALSESLKLEKVIAETVQQKNDALKAATQLQTEYNELKKEEAGLEPPTPPTDDLKGYFDQASAAWKAYVEEIKNFDPTVEFGNNMFNYLRGIRGQLGGMFSDIVTGSKSAKEAFADFARNMIKAMIDIIAQALAMQVVKSIMGSFGFGLGFSSGGSVGTSSSGLSAGDIPMTNLAAKGGLMPQQRYTKVTKNYALGSTVTGGMPGKDSVRALLMPGEFVLKKSVVDMLGPDFLNAANSESNYVVNSTNKGAAQKEQPKASEPTMVNVWIVPKDEVPQQGPQDIIAIVADDMSRGGVTKKLVKQIVVSG